MSLRPGRAYHHFAKKPYTRISSRKPRQSYVKGVPVSKIHQFETGAVDIKFPKAYNLVARKEVQMRSNCLESARISATSYLISNLGEKGFFLKILTYPHHVLREKPLATGAGADRFSQGMRRSFGKPIGQAARVCLGQKVITVKFFPGAEKIAKEALRRAATKLPGSCRIV